ncbi:MAG: GPP34 family phosphoprotein [Acidobacteria bacterium]|nr:GPP34 family phosphoprotein [Acidobacteriota bacterium]
MKLTLAEELLLLSLRNDKGTVLCSASVGLPFGLAAAVLMELAMQEKVRIEGKKLVAVPTGDTDDAVLDECLNLIRAAAKPKTVQSWVSRLGDRKSIRRAYLDRLVQKRILRREEHRILWVFPTERFPTSNPLEELEVRRRLRRTAFTATAPDARTRFLVSLVQACDLAGEVFPDGDERKEAKQRFAELVKEEAFGKAVSDQVAAVMAACAAACAAACVAATVTACS